MMSVKTLQQNPKAAYSPQALHFPFSFSFSFPFPIPICKIQPPRRKPDCNARCFKHLAESLSLGQRLASSSGGKRKPRIHRHIFTSLPNTRPFLDLLLNRDDPLPIPVIPATHGQIVPTHPSSLPFRAIDPAPLLSSLC
jgi:hypothetical protein